MNEFLAGLYNTRETIGSTQDNTDVEKLAEAQILDEALQAQGIDIDSISPEQLQKLASEVLGPDSILVKEASAEAKPFAGKETPAEEAKEHKVLLEKAKKEMEHKKEAAAAPAPVAAPVAQPEEETFEQKVAQADFLGRVMAHSYVNELNGIQKEASAKEMAAKAEQAKDDKKPYLAAPAEAHKFKKKEGSAIDDMAEKVANEWLAAHGITVPKAAEPTEEEKVAAAVNQRAYELLKEAGVDVDAIQAAAAQKTQEKK